MALMRRIGLIGAGMVSQHHLLAWRAAHPRAKVMAIADPSHEHAQQRATAFDVPATYDTIHALLAAASVDAIDIAAPREVHVEAVCAAAQVGIPVLCQKPLAPTLAQAESLVMEVADRTRLMVHENWRFRPYYRQIAQWLKEGRVGCVVQCSMTLFSSGLLPDHNGNRPALVRQPFMQSLDRMLVNEVLIHHIDTLRYLFGPLQLDSAYLGRSYKQMRGEDRATLVLRTGEGGTVLLQANLAVHGAPPALTDQLRIIGEDGTVTLDGAELNLASAHAEHRSYDLAACYQSSYDSTIAHFLDCLDSGAPFETAPEDNLKTLALVEAAYERASRSGMD
ncbi:MAG: Gfo/Idh/MocA family oxidoreductase [Pseudomonadota bacterium]|nr:Gfo/Idh/MocA family oxidoreductase [Pseudomonadota bacterium]